jgi:hypothetical protein
MSRWPVTAVRLCRDTPLSFDQAAPYFDTAGCLPYRLCEVASGVGARAFFGSHHVDLMARFGKSVCVQVRDGAGGVRRQASPSLLGVNPYRCRRRTNSVLALFAAVGARARSGGRGEATPWVWPRA